MTGEDFFIWFVVVPLTILTCFEMLFTAITRTSFIASLFI